jgi:Fe-Mn family superoxide dismutase
MEQIIFPIKPNFLQNNNEYIGYSVLSLHQNRTHYNGHYMKYIKKLNELIINDDKYNKIYNLIKQKYSKDEYKMLLLLTGIKLFDHDTLVYRNASQIYNHELYWNTITTINNSIELLKIYKNQIFLTDDDLLLFNKKFVDEGVKHFGSGWLWIFFNYSNNRLDVSTTHDSVVLFDSSNTKILGVIDLWEHAYYIDYESDRKKYLEESLKILNWKKLSEIN